MAARSNTAPTHSAAMLCLSSVIRDAKVQANAVQEATDHLVSLMRAIHGGDWRIQIDHEVKMVVVVQKGGDCEPIQKPRSGELV